MKNQIIKGWVAVCKEDGKMCHYQDNDNVSFSRKKKNLVFYYKPPFYEIKRVEIKLIN